jgi:hypothetical protein
MVVSADGAVVGSRLEVQTGWRRQACKDLCRRVGIVANSIRNGRVVLVLGNEGAERCVQQTLNLL